MSEQQTLATYANDQEKFSTPESERYKDPDWLRERYVTNRKSIAEIADECGVSDHTIGRWLKKHGIDTRSISESKLSEGAIEKLRDEEWMQEQYVEQRRTPVDIADECGAGATTIRRWLEKHNIETRSVSESVLPEGAIEKLRDEEWMQEQYVEQRQSTHNIADELNISFSAVIAWLQKHGIETRGFSESHLPEEAIEKLRDEEWMQEQYVEHRRTTVDIADELNISSPAVVNSLQRHDIEIRGYSEAALPEGVKEKLRDEKWLREQYVEQHQSTVEIADELNISPTPIRWRLQSYGIEIRNGIQNPDYLDHKVRSGWELHIANLLTKYDISYEYEAIEISWGDGRIYIPDFITEHYAIEIKGRLYPGNNVAEKAEAALDTLDERDYVLVATDRVAEQVPHDIHISWENREKLIDLLKDD